MYPEIALAITFGLVGLAIGTLAGHAAGYAKGRRERFRSYAQQLEIWKQRGAGRAHPPGTSLHSRTPAFDFDIPSPTEIRDDADQTKDV